MLLCMNQVRLNYTIAEELENRLAGYCNITGRTASDVVRQLIYEFLEGDRALPPPAVVSALARNGTQKDRRTDMWVSPQTFKSFGDRLDQDGYAGKSAAISCLLDEFLSSRANHTADELVRVTVLIDRETFTHLRNVGAVRNQLPEQLIAELSQNFVNTLKNAGTKA